MQAPHPGENLGMLRPLFLSVTHLTLDASANRVVDLTALHTWPGLEVWVEKLGDARLIGAGELGDRLNATSR